MSLKIKVSYFTRKNTFIPEQQIIAIWDKQAMVKATGKSNKGEEQLFYGEKGGSWQGLF